jgi:hypothetical protein
VHLGRISDAGEFRLGVKGAQNPNARISAKNGDNAHTECPGRRFDGARIRR